MLLVRIEASDGTTGWGDAVPLSLRGGPGTAAVRDELESACIPALAGAEIGAEPARFAADALGRCRARGVGPQAASAIDIALLDLCGKLEGLPAWRLLGASAAAPVACNASIGADPPDAAASAAVSAVRAGFGTLKVKVGDAGDLDRVQAVRAATGPGALLRVDANGSWDPTAALARIAALEPLGIELVEQPCPTAADLAAVRAATGLPVVADESVADLASANAAMRLGAFDAATLKLAKVGGPHAAVEIAAAVPAYLSSALDSAFGIAAAAHTAQAMRRHGFAAGRAHGLATSPLFADNLADDGYLSGPEIEVGDTPGLGVDVEPEAIERLRLR
jgi:L-alanine-DL-glutamate epimerase-like enolase superfamily enzyme